MNPIGTHTPWSAPSRLYQVQLTIPGTLNVEGATLAGIPQPQPHQKGQFRCAE